jgi:hypothetical protein
VVNYLKYIKIGVITLLLFGSVSLLSGIVCADQGVPAVPEIQGLVTGTTADVVGLVMETDVGAWTLTNNPVILTIVNNQSGTDLQAEPEPLFNLWQAQFQGAGGSIDGYSLGNGLIQPTQYNIPQSIMNEQIPGFEPGYTWGQAVSTLTDPLTTTGKGIHTGALDPGQVQYTTAYDANIVAQGGHTSFVKQMNFHTGNKVISQSNLIAKTGLAFAATSGGGNVVGSENLMLDGAGYTTTAYDRTLCPFASAGGNYIPAYCNIVQMGSNYDLTVGSVTTQADTRFVGTDATNPIVQNFQVNIEPYSTTSGQIPASGTTSAYIRAHIQEARNNGTPLKSEDLLYSETSSARGAITMFSKSMAYSSQFTGSPKESTPTIYHTITATAVQGTWISPAGSVQVPDHGSQTFTMGGPGGSPVRIIVNGVHYGFGYSYTFPDVTSDQTIEVQFGA